MTTAAEFDRLSPAKQAELLHELFLERVWQQPRAYSDPESACKPPALNIPQLLRDGIAARRFAGPLPRSDASERSRARVRAIAQIASGELDACKTPLAAIAESESRGVLHAFAGPEVERDVLRGRGIQSFSTLSVHTRVEFPPVDNSPEIRLLRASVRNALRGLYAKNSNLRKCGERRIVRTPVTARVKRLDDGSSRAMVGGLVRCASVHSCVKCAPRISAARAEQLRAIVNAHRERTRTPEHPEGAVYMLTVTAPHRAGMKLRPLGRAFADAWRKVCSGREWYDFKLRMNFTGAVRARETTHGANGFHPHFHILITSSRVWDDDELARFRFRFFVKWALAIRARRGVANAYPDPFHGVDLVRCFDESYIAKLGLADELTGAMRKRGRAENRTPFQIMADYARTHSADDARTLRHYIRGMKGARQLTWTRGRAGAEDLRKVYAAALAAIAPEAAQGDFGFESDVELLRREEREGAIVAQLPGRQWDALVRVMHRARGDAEYELVTAAEADGSRGVEAMLARAHVVGRELAKKDPRLRRWLWWLAPPD